MPDVLKAMGKLARSSLHLYLKTNVAFLRDGALASHVHVPLHVPLHVRAHDMLHMLSLIHI